MFPPSWFCTHEVVREVENHYTLNPPKCGACECPIAGEKMFKCTSCNSNLHPFCKSCPPFLTDSVLHPIPGHVLILLNRDFSSPHTARFAPRHSCVVCGEDVKGVSYSCVLCDLYVHPQCSQIPRSIPHGPNVLHVFELRVSNDIHNARCSVCGDRCDGWVYRCDVCSVDVHFWCLLRAVGRDESSRYPTTSTSIRGGRQAPLPQRQHTPNYGPYNYSSYSNNHGPLNYEMPNNIYNGGYPWGWYQNPSYVPAGGGGPRTGAGGLIRRTMEMIGGSSLSVDLLCNVLHWSCLSFSFPLITLSLGWVKY